MKSLLLALLAGAAPGGPLAYHWAEHAGPEPAPLAAVLDVDVLEHLQSTGSSLGEMLGGARASGTAELYAKSPRYRAFADTLGRPIAHDPKTDQLPALIPNDAGDVPEMVRLLRGFEDRGKRSAKDTKGGFFIHHLSNNSQYPYTVEYDGDEPRHFDTRWLSSPHASFQLIAVVNRLDRRDFEPAGCGDIRFVYRLAYRSKQSRSFLPFVINVVHRYPSKPDCGVFAKAWMVPAKTSAALRSAPDAPARFARWLQQGPLAGTAFAQLEVNFQALRFTSGYMHDLGGQAMYMQRIFRTSEERLEPVGLENTPDVLAVRKDPALLERFVAFLARPENLRALDRGTLVVDFDPAFLAKRAVSWSTLGRARIANRPYRMLFEDKMALLDDIDLSSMRFVKSKAALLERLDNLTCMGCHQAGGTAGFHMLGFADPRFSHGFNEQALPYSPHVHAELTRRRRYLAALAAGRAPDRFRPHSSFPPVGVEHVPVRSTCVLAAGHFSDAPACAPLDGQPATCRATATAPSALFGECTLAPAPSAAHYFAGGVCFEGELLEEPDLPSLPAERGVAPTANFFAFQDRLALKGRLHRNLGRRGQAARYSCASPKSGAPLGRRGRRCSAAEETFEVLDGVVPKGRAPVTIEDFRNGKLPSEICANQGGNGFDMCAALGDSGECLQSRVVRAMLDTCAPGAFCREDYICQRLPEYHRIRARDYGRKKKGRRINRATPKAIHGDRLAELRAADVGFCVPTYFLFNMRVDGHPSPVTGRSPGRPKYDRTQPVRGYTP